MHKCCQSLESYSTLYEYTHRYYSGVAEVLKHNDPRVRRRSTKVDLVHLLLSCNYCCCRNAADNA